MFNIIINIIYYPLRWFIKVFTILFCLILCAFILNLIFSQVIHILFPAFYNKPKGGFGNVFYESFVFAFITFIPWTFLFGFICYLIDPAKIEKNKENKK